MSEKKLSYLGIFVSIAISLNLYYIWDAERKVFEMNQCNYDLVEVALSAKAQSERNLKEIQYAISNSEDGEKLELIGKNLELQWQNEKLVRELLNMFTLLRGMEMPLNNPPGKTSI